MGRCLRQFHSQEYKFTWIKLNVSYFKLELQLNLLQLN